MDFESSALQRNKSEKQSAPDFARAVPSYPGVPTCYHESTITLITTAITHQLNPALMPSNLGHLRIPFAVHCWPNLYTQPILHMKRPNYFLGLSHVPVLENKSKGFFARLTYTWSQDRIVRIGARGRSMFAASVKFISPSPIASKVFVSRQ